MSLSCKIIRKKGGLWYQENKEKEVSPWVLLELKKMSWDLFFRKVQYLEGMEGFFCLLSVVFALCAPVIIYTEDAMQEMVMLPTAYNVVSQEPALDKGSPTYFIPPKTRVDSPPVSSPREWYIIAKHPTSKHLMIGVFWIQEGMPIEHIYSILGKEVGVLKAKIVQQWGDILQQLLKPSRTWKETGVGVNFQLCPLFLPLKIS